MGWVGGDSGHTGSFMSAWFPGTPGADDKVHGAALGLGGRSGVEPVTGAVRSGDPEAGLWMGHACAGPGCSGRWQVWGMGGGRVSGARSPGSEDGTQRTVGGCGQQDTLGWIVSPKPMTFQNLRIQPNLEAGSLQMGLVKMRSH